MSEPLHQPLVTVDPETEETSRPRLLPPYHVILENDDYHSFEFVMVVLCKVFGFSTEKAFLHTQEAHNSGQAVVWTGSKEVAELKLDQVRSLHEERDDGRKLGPLSCRIEPAA